MRVRRAEELFHGKEGYNCAQAIAAAFSKDALDIENYRAFGGGRAPENTCGAVYAGASLLNKEQSETFKKAFRQQTGALKCRELKRDKKVPCKDCIKISAELLNKIMD